MPAQYHHLPYHLARQNNRNDEARIGRETQAYWAVGDPRKLMIFVHGFMGSANRTWDDFYRLLPALPDAADCDIIYYDYDGKFTQASTSAVRFFKFLESFLDDPLATINRTLPERARRTGPVNYERIVIVAHSLGAIITRRALLYAHDLNYGRSRQKNLPWLDKIRFVLFAPAHRGAYAAELALEALSDQDWFIADIISLATRYKTPLLKDLAPNSAVLTELLERYNQVCASLTAQASTSYLIAHQVILAEDERVVINLPFGDDPPPDEYPGTNHVQVCKPRRPGDLPVTAVLNALI